MDNQTTLSKGELMEELLRNYFLSLGYYVVRGVQYRYEGNDITDIDLYLYGRTSSMTRERINVDLKNKKSPQAFERILWANGLMKLLDFDSCIVATTDSRPVIHTYGKLHKTRIMDGKFLDKLRKNSHPERISEDDLLIMLAKNKNFQINFLKDWRFMYEKSKSKLLTEQDFSGFNETILNLQFFLEKILTDKQKTEASLRMLYITISHALLIMDFIIKDIAFLQQEEREKILSDGFKYGNLGRSGVKKMLSMAEQISGKRAQNLFSSLDNPQTDILKDFFVRNENAKNVFNWAKEFEASGFSSNLTNPEKIEAPLKGVVAVFLDYFKVERRKFFGLFVQEDDMGIDKSKQ